MSFPDMWGIHGSQIAESYKFVKIAQIFLRTRRFHAELPINLHFVISFERPRHWTPRIDLQWQSHLHRMNATHSFWFTGVCNIISLSCLYIPVGQINEAERENKLIEFAPIWKWSITSARKSSNSPSSSSGSTTYWVPETYLNTTWRPKNAQGVQNNSHVSVQLGPWMKFPNQTRCLTCEVNSRKHVSNFLESPTSCERNIQ